MFRCRVAVLLIAVALFTPSLGRAYGPGVHVVESTRALELLQQVEPVWTEHAAAPKAMSYLWFGAVSPDLQWYCDTVDFGHSLSLSFHLLQAAAEAGPEYLMFAFGHLTHNASDPSSECFVAPALIASAPIGATDMFAGFDGGEAESEGLIEVYGDLIIGNWDGFVDVVFDMWMEDEAAEARGEDIVRWYCAEGAAFLGRSVDCDAVWEELGGLLTLLDEYVGNYDRQGAKNFVHFMIDRPLEDLVDLFASGAFSGLAGDLVALSENIDDEMARLKGGPLTDPAFWDQYAARLADHGPHWAVDRYLTHDTGWPAHNYEAMTCGNIESLMQFFPDDFDVVPGLVVDEIRWTNGAGSTVAAIDPAAGTQNLATSLRVYSTYPLSATIRGVVREHRPAVPDKDGTIVGEATIDVDINPLEYVGVLRDVLTIPFAIDPTADDFGSLLGVTVDLYLDDAELPWLTTRWERLWDVRDAPIDLPVYQNNFGTYGHFPSSLPVAGAVDARRFLVVRVRDADSSDRLQDVLVTAGGTSGVTGVSGIFRAELGEGEQELLVSAEGYEEAEASVVTLEAGETRVVELLLTKSPEPVVEVVEDADVAVGEPDVMCHTEIVEEVVEPDSGAEPDITAKPDLGAPDLNDPDTNVDEPDVSTDRLAPGGSDGCSAGNAPSSMPFALLLFTFSLLFRRRLCRVRP